MRKKSYALVLGIVLISLLLGACGDDDKKSDEEQSYNVGILVQSAALAQVAEGFKTGMGEAGYTEGKNVEYFYSGPTGTLESLKPEAETLKTKDLDLVLSIGTPATQAAQEVFADTDVPILFAIVVDPVGLGLVESLRNPGGKLTGIVSTDTVGKALEWLIQAVPGVQRVYVPHVPADSASVQSLQSLTETAQTMNVELVVVEGTTPEELDAITQTFPEDVDAIFMPRSASLSSRLPNMIQASSERGIPVACSDANLMAAGVTIGYGPRYPETGKQAARLADQILKGTDTATLPVENAEAFLSINLQSAQAAGIEIPDAVLQQAYQIIRDEAE